jgi:hypothetical protein
MPFKQISGNHISGLSLNPKQRASLAPGSTIARPISSVNSAAVAARANLPPLNIQTVFELAEEIKISSFSTISSGESTVDGTSNVVAGVSGGSTAVEVLNNLKNNLTPEIDKNDFVKQMDLSRVIGKEVYEPIFQLAQFVVTNDVRKSFRCAILHETPVCFSFSGQRAIQVGLGDDL